MPTKEKYARASPESKERSKHIVEPIIGNIEEKRLAAAVAWAKAHREIQSSRMRLECRRARGLHVAGDEQREGKCPLCSKIGKLVPDHPFGIDRIRGWICNLCNLHLGQFEAGKLVESIRNFVSIWRELDESFIFKLERVDRIIWQIFIPWLTFSTRSRRGRCQPLGLHVQGLLQGLALVYSL